MNGPSGEAVGSKGGRMRAIAIAVVAGSMVATLGVPASAADGGASDAVVVAVIDTLPSPYHWDFLAAHMPQALNADSADDLPLDVAPHTWLPGFPSPDAFESYQPLELTLEAEEPDVIVPDLQAEDEARWRAVQSSGRAGVNYYWLPGTKLIGLVDFAGTAPSVAQTSQLNAQHGAHTSAVSVGNIHGTCPECLLVFITVGSSAQGEAAIEWAMSQPWIDAITNSYGYSLIARDRLYSGSDVAAQRAATERGQTVFFSAGNGQDGGFLVPNTTYFSSQEGPDWIVTVGATAPSGSSYTGSGRPADIAAPGGSYPSLGGATVAGESTFSGTSNATPVIAGMYARALYRARAALAGDSRAQDTGVIARGAPVACGEARAACELGDGELTARELRARMFAGAIPTPRGPQGTPEVSREESLMTEGHGTYVARLVPEQWALEQGRILAPMLGDAAALARPAGETEWFTVDSYCRQTLWGSWDQGYFRDGVTPLPPADPVWPVRTALVASCGSLFPPV